MEAIIRIKDLTKIYRLGDEKVVALDRINLEIQKGQICCILGTSGSGKSTLLNQLAGLEKPTKGAVYIGRTNISKLSENQLAVFRQKHLGFVFQSYNLMASMTALENVSLPLMFKGVPRRQREQSARKLLKMVGLQDRAGHRPTQMSGGQQQRVGIARAFISKPSIVFADEPTGNLDTKTTKEVMELMIRMARRYNQTIVLVTHDVSMTEYADRVITLVDGKIVDDRPGQGTINYPPLHLQAGETPENEQELEQEILPEEQQAPDGGEVEYIPEEYAAPKHQSGDSIVEAELPQPTKA